MSIQISGSCYNCGTFATTGYEHPIESDVVVVCPDCTPQKLKIIQREKNIDKLLRVEKRKEFWKSIRSFLSL